MEKTAGKRQGFHTVLSNSSAIDTETPSTGLETDAWTESTAKEEIPAERRRSYGRSLTCIQQQQQSPCPACR